MSFLLEIIMRVGDIVYSLKLERSRFDSGMKEAAKDASQHGRTAGNAFSTAASAAVGSASISLDRPLERAMSSAQGVARSGSSKIGSIITGVFTGVGQQITSIMIGAVTSSIGALSSLTSKMIEVGSNAENLQIAFRAIIGDVGKADKLLADMRQFSASTPFTGTQVQEAGQRLLTVVKPEEMITTLRRLGEVASGTNSNIGDLATIYSQVLSKGKFQAEEMLQFAERGIPIQQALADVLGVQVSEVGELGSKGKISGDIMVKAFAKLSDEGGKFNGIMEKQSKTVTGLASTMQDGFEASLKTVYDKLNPALVATLKSIDSASQAAGKQEGALDLVARAASNVENFLKKHQPEIDKAAAAAARMATDGLAMVLTASENIYEWLNKNPEVMEAILGTSKLVSNSFETIVQLAKFLAPALEPFVNILTEALKVITKIIDGLQTAVNSTLEFTRNTLFGEPQPQATGQISTGKTFKVIDPDGRPVRNLATTKVHHDGAQDRDNFVKRDFTIVNPDGSTTNAPIPAPTAGRVISTESQRQGKGGLAGWGHNILIRAEDGTTYRVAHLNKPPALKVGDKVAPGDIIGLQGSTGKSSGNHVHWEGAPWNLDKMLRGLNTGMWDAGRTSSNAPTGGIGGSASASANVKGFLNALAKYESDGNLNAVGSNTPTGRARGKYQFMGMTRQEVLGKTGFDAWGDEENQDKAAEAYIKMTSRQAWEHIQRGEYEKAAPLLNKRWTSLPGGAEASGKLKQFPLSSFRPGASQSTPQRRNTNIPINRPTPQVTPATSTQLKPKEVTEAIAKLQTAEKETEKTAEELERIKRETLTVLSKKADTTGVFSEAEFRKVFLAGQREKTADDDYWNQYNEWVEAQIKNSKEKGENIAEAIGKLREKEAADLELELEQKRLNRQKGVDIQGAIARNTQERYDDRDSQVNRATTLFSSNVNLAEARAGAIRDPDQRRSAQKSVAEDSIRLELVGQLHQIEQMGRSGEYTNEQLSIMRNNVSEMAQIRMDKLNDQFLTLGQTITQTVGQGFSTFLQDVLSGTKSINDSFGDMLRSIAGSVAQMGISRLVGGLFGGGISAFAGGSGEGMNFSSLGKAWGYEKAVSGRQPKLAVINDGEMVMSYPQVEALKAAIAGAHMGGFTSFASGSFSAKGGGGTTVNLGDIHIGESSPAGSEERLKKLIKGAIYGVIQKEKGQGGMLR